MAKSLLMSAAFTVITGLACGAAPLPGRTGPYKLEVRPSLQVPFKLPAMPTPVVPLPSAFDLAPDMPPAGNQADLAASSAWAAAYLKGYWDGKEFGWNFKTPNQRFDPAFLYSQIAGLPDDSLTMTQIMLMLKQNGIPTQDVSPYRSDTISVTPSLAVKLNAAQYIPSEIHCIDTPSSGYTKGVFRNVPLDLDKIKQYLVERGPVVTAVLLLDRYALTSNPDWELSSAELADTASIEAHLAGSVGICVTGYDDHHGPNGAFHFLNSWGSVWTETDNEAGYGWLGYEYAQQLSFDWWGLADYPGVVAGMVGSVTNTSNPSILPSNVRMKLTGGGKTFSAVTDRSGQYQFLGIPPGTYKIEKDPNYSLFVTSQPSSVNVTVSATGITSVTTVFNLAVQSTGFTSYTGGEGVAVSLSSNDRTVVIVATLSEAQLDYDHVETTISGTDIPIDTMLTVRRGNYPAQYLYSNLANYSLPADDVYYFGDGFSTTYTRHSDLYWSNSSSNKVYFTLSTASSAALDCVVQVQFKIASTMTTRAITCQTRLQDASGAILAHEPVLMSRDLTYSSQTNTQGTARFAEATQFPGRYKLEIQDSLYKYRPRVKWVDLETADAQTYFLASPPSLDLNGDGYIDWQEVLMFQQQWLSYPSEDTGRRGETSNSHDR